jgi:GNAT superfamily N-acetyltransferase
VSIQAHCQRLENSPVACHGFVVRDAARHAVACALLASEGEFVGLYDVFTAPAARGRGLSRQLCGQLLRRAAAQGARRAYLQVEAGNHAARAVYAKLGFEDAYRYHYRALPHAADVVAASQDS